MTSRPRCPTCGSRKWHKEPSSGLIACSEGHILQNYRNEATDADDLGPHALRKRTLKSRRKKKAGKSKANPQLYHGARGRYHYFECQQLLLRKQVAILIRLWNLPLEFEVVCRDVWALHLTLLSDPPPAEPYYDAQTLPDDEEEEGKGRGAHEENIRTSGEESYNDDGVELEKEEKGKDGNDGDDINEEIQGDDDDEETEEDPELIALLRLNSDFEESSEGDDKGSVKEGQRRERLQIRKPRVSHVYESPASTIAVLMVACWTMRVPVLFRDFIRLIETYELPYLDPVARHLLPRSMVIHLSKSNIQALSPHYAPSTLAVHKLASRLSRLMYNLYGILTPEANGAPILWRIVSQGLGGTRALYGMTKRLGQILTPPLTLHHTLAPGLENLKSYGAGRHIYNDVAPEVALIGTGIIALKMVYGLDGRSRVPRDDDGVACMLPEVREYLEGLKKLNEEDKWNINGLFDSRQQDVCIGDFNESEIDEYLTFSEHALVGGTDGDGLLERYFPLRKSDRIEGTRSARGEGRREGRAVMMNESPSELRPGEGYRIYRSRDTQGTVSEEYEVVLNRAARWVGVPVEYMGRVVEIYERRILRWCRVQINSDM